MCNMFLGAFGETGIPQEEKKMYNIDKNVQKLGKMSIFKQKSSLPASSNKQEKASLMMSMSWFLIQSPQDASTTTGLSANTFQALSPLLISFPFFFPFLFSRTDRRVRSGGRCCWAVLGGRRDAWGEEERPSLINTVQFHQSASRPWTTTRSSAAPGSPSWLLGWCCGDGSTLGDERQLPV